MIFSKSNQALGCGVCLLLYFSLEEADFGVIEIDVRLFTSLIAFTLHNLKTLQFLQNFYTRRTLRRAVMSSVSS